MRDPSLIRPPTLPKLLAREPEARFLARQSVEARMGVRRALASLEHALIHALDPRVMIRRNRAAGTIATVLVATGALGAVWNRERMLVFATETARTVYRALVNAALARWLWQPLALALPPSRHTLFPSGPDEAGGRDGRS